MSARDRIDDIIGLLAEAELDEARWSEASALIDDACGLQGNDLVLARLHAKGGIDVELRWLRLRGEFVPEVAHAYTEDLAATDERGLAGVRQPPGALTHTNSLLPADVRRRSPTYNEYLLPYGGENCLNTWLPGGDGRQVAWSLVGPGGGDPGAWTSEQAQAIRVLFPHVRHFVLVRHALAQARADGMRTAALLDTRRIGMLLLDRQGRIVEANDRARAMLRHANGNGLTVREGRLAAVRPAEADRLARLLDGACRAGSRASMPIARPPRAPLVVYATPLAATGERSWPERIAARVLLAEPFSSPPVNARLVSEALGLTPAQGRVVAALAEGGTVASIAAATHRTEAAVRWHIREALARLGLSRQADLVRVALSTPGVFEDGD